jgi:hypothetical protein
MVAMIMVAGMVALHVAVLILSLLIFQAVQDIAVGCVTPAMVDPTAALHNIEATGL